MTERLLITGITGFIGSRLATRAQSEGFIVRSLSRREWDGPPFVAPEERFRATFPLNIPAAAFRGVDVVVHAAAQLSGSDKKMHALNVETTRALAEKSRAAGVKTFIFLSSQSARADAAATYGKTKFEAEQKLLEFDRPNIVILRPGLVIGRNSRGLFGRMERLVERLPIIPLLGGGKALVQPIHVDDLCDAILVCARRGSEFHRSILHLGDPEGSTLKELLQETAVARTGRRKPMLSIPIAPLILAASAAEKLHIPLPVTKNNLEGARKVIRMDTAADLQRVGVRRRPLNEMLGAGQNDVHEPAKSRAVRTLLIGAGRVGLVHAVTLSRLRGIMLAGLVDSNAAACKLLRGMGITAPDFRSIDDALKSTGADAAVIATPPATHLPLTKTCLERGLSVLVEKPLAKNAEQLVEYERLANEFPERSISVGYVMPKNPQVRSLIDRLKAGEFGRVRRFLGVTLLSFVQESKTRRWEVRKDVSGGGALINAGGHVLSMIRAAFGEPVRVRAEMHSPYSAEVEDSAVLQIEFDGFSGTHYCSWSIAGYPRQENLLTIWTDRGRVVLTGSVGLFIPDDGNMEVMHQLDFDLEFNLAPDYAGGGFTNELAALRNLDPSPALRAPSPRERGEGPRSGGEGSRNPIVDRNELSEAIALERLLFRIYDNAQRTSHFTISDPSANVSANGQRPTTNIQRILDLRDAPVVIDSERWSGFEISVDQLKSWPKSSHDRLRVTVPDFLNLSRLIAAGRAIEVVKRLGPLGMIAGMWTATPKLLADRAPTFWVAAMGMLGAALQKMPGKFSGTVFLHGYLADFALSLGRLDMLEAMLRRCRSAVRHGRVGVHSNLASDLASALRTIDESVDDISVLSSPHAFEIEKRFEELRSAYPKTPRLTAEVGLAPWAVHRYAAEHPELWAHGAESVLIGYAAEPRIAQSRIDDLRREWIKVFPGTAIPEGVL